MVNNLNIKLNYTLKNINIIVILYDVVPFYLYFPFDTLLFLFVLISIMLKMFVHSHLKKKRKKVENINIILNKSQHHIYMEKNILTSKKIIVNKEIINL